MLLGDLMAQWVALASLACLENRCASPFDAKGGQIGLIDGESKEFGLTAYSIDGAGRYAQISGCLLRAWISAVVPLWPQPTTKIGECLCAARVRCARSAGIAATERLKSAGAMLPRIQSVKLEVQCVLELPPSCSRDDSISELEDPGQTSDLKNPGQMSESAMTLSNI